MQVVSKPSRRAREVFSAGDGESAAYIPPSYPLLARSPAQEGTHVEVVQASGKVILLFCQHNSLFPFIFVTIFHF